MEEVKFTDAIALLEHLNPLDWKRWPQGQFIYRGQPDANFKLVPSIWRDSLDVSAATHWGSRSISADEQIRFEQHMLSEFITACDRSGIQIPGDSDKMRDQVRDPVIYSSLPRTWPPAEVSSLLAFAQHHGVPTRLLDWSKRAYVAAYFAASSALESNRSGELAIWALNVAESERWSNARLLSAPGGISPHIAAQSGLFTVSSTVEKHDHAFAPLAFENHLNVNRLASGETALIKMVLPASQAPWLLHGCEVLGVSGATMFPGIEGVAKMVKDRARARRRRYDPNQKAVRDLFL